MFDVFEYRQLGIYPWRRECGHARASLTDFSLDDNRCHCHRRVPSFSPSSFADAAAVVKILQSITRTVTKKNFFPPPLVQKNTQVLFSSSVSYFSYYHPPVYTAAATTPVVLTAVPRTWTSVGRDAADHYTTTTASVNISWRNINCLFLVVCLSATPFYGPGRPDRIRRPYRHLT